MPDKEQLSDEELEMRLNEVIQTMEDQLKNNDKILQDQDDGMKKLKKDLDDLKRSFEKTNMFKTLDKLSPEEREKIAKLVAEDHAQKKD